MFIVNTGNPNSHFITSTSSPSWFKNDGQNGDLQRREREKSLLQAGQQQVQNEVDGGTLTCLLLCDSRLFLGLQFEEKENAQQACICGQNTLESVDNKIRKSFQRLVFNIVAHLSYLKFYAWHNLRSSSLLWCMHWNIWPSQWTGAGFRRRVLPWWISSDGSVAKGEIHILELLLVEVIGGLLII